MADMTLKLKYMDPVQFGKFWDKYEATVIELMKPAKDQ
jgi:hypothetical protein